MARRTHHRWSADKTAIDKLSAGDAVIIFTPDSKLAYLNLRELPMTIQCRHSL